MTDPEITLIAITDERGNSFMLTLSELRKLKTKVPDYILEIKNI